MEIERVIIIVLDSLGVGALADAADYGDEGSNTLRSVATRSRPRPLLTNLTSLGLGLVQGAQALGGVSAPLAHYGRMKEKNTGKDTIAGHLEIAGVILDKPFALFPNGFGTEILKKFSSQTGYGYLFGKAASGTEIIERFGPKHLKTAKPIIYTSADSVFQVAAHEDIIPLKELYRICARARGFLDEYNIGRVIARPFTGRQGHFVRSSGRRDYSLSPKDTNLLEKIKQSGRVVTGIGKIGDIYAHKGLTREIHTAKGNAQGIEATLEALGEQTNGLIFTNLVDFDMLYGHRNDIDGYARALEEFDLSLPALLKRLTANDLLILTADHGCDPAYPGTDHTREYVPLLVYNKNSIPGTALGTRDSFADIAQTIAVVFELAPFAYGDSFLDKISNPKT